MFIMATFARTPHAPREVRRITLRGLPFRSLTSRIVTPCYAPVPRAKKGDPQVQAMFSVSDREIVRPRRSHLRASKGFFPLPTLLAFSAENTCASYLFSKEGLAPSRNSLIPLPAIKKAREIREISPKTPDFP